MALRDLIGDKRLAFSDHLGYTRLCAPNRYPSEGITDLEHDFVRLQARWEALKADLERDLDKIPEIEQLLQRRAAGLSRRRPPRRHRGHQTHRGHEAGPSAVSAQKTTPVGGAATDALLSPDDIARLVAGKPISATYPWHTGDEQAIEGHLKRACAAVQRHTGTQSRIVWDHYGSGYASYVDGWFFRPTDAFRVMRPASPGETYSGLVVLLGRLSPHYALMQGEKGWSDRSGHGYLPHPSMLDAFHTEAVAVLAAEVAPVLDALGMTRLRPEQASIPLADDVTLPTILTDGRPFTQFDAIFHWED